MIEFSYLLNNIAEKQLLAEELFENFILHLNEDMEGVDIEVKNKNGQIKYKITRTPRYYKIANESIKTSHIYHVSATNTKDDIVSNRHVLYSLQVKCCKDIDNIFDNLT